MHKINNLDFFITVVIVVNFILGCVYVFIDRSFVDLLYLFAVMFITVKFVRLK